MAKSIVQMLFRSKTIISKINPEIFSYSEETAIASLETAGFEVYFHC
ncbi:MAG: hypothetical protein AAF298_22275 [Cyanobacteria bacterium P01_A01_bin.40]